MMLTSVRSVVVGLTWVRDSVDTTYSDILMASCYALVSES